MKSNTMQRPTEREKKGTKRERERERYVKYDLMNSRDSCFVPGQDITHKQARTKNQLQGQKRLIFKIICHDIISFYKIVNVHHRSTKTRLGKTRRHKLRDDTRATCRKKQKTNTTKSASDQSVTF
mmetsp:Transcript_26115/g.62045  ORF Transcript_26115/g.62045 Transcript_26115/m.62045 type:complete len:125 (-) Transcript_26115:882-1256(-)